MKDVELNSGTWKEMKKALSNITETSSGTGSYSYSYGSGPGMSNYTGSTSSVGFGRRVRDLIEISERVNRLIDEKDTDNVIDYRYHDNTQEALNLQNKLQALEKYAGNVDKYIKEKIDQPFYEAMDKVAEKLEALSIHNYKTENHVGYKTTIVIEDEYGRKVGTKEVTPKEIGIEELFKVNNPYQAALRQDYLSKKISGEIDDKLTMDDYVMLAHNTRYFEYESISEKKEHIETVRDLLLMGGVIILSIFCPPAGAVAGVALATADAYSGVTGKDWMTGRELDGMERGMRIAFSLFDLVPGIKYVGKLGKAGKESGKLGIKTLLKQSLAQGWEKGLKNIDSLKSIIPKVKNYGDSVLKQLDIRLNNMLISGADNLSSGLKKFDNAVSQAAQNFRLNRGFEPQLVEGVMQAPKTGQFNKITNKLDDFSKVRKSHVDDMMKSSKDFGLNGGGKVSKLIDQRLKEFSKGNLKFEDVLEDYSKKYSEVVQSNQTWSWREDIPFGRELTNTQKKIVKEHAIKNGLLPKVNVLPSKGMKYGFADFKGAGLVEETVELPKDLWLKSDKEQFEWLNKQIGGMREGMTWHHTEIPGKMELVPFGVHNITPHNGGRTIGMWAYGPR